MILKVVYYRLVSTEVDILAFGVTGNTTSASVVFDNYNFSASAADTLSNGQEVSLQDENNNLIAYPNPVENILNIQSYNKFINRILIYNTLGQQVMNNQGDFGLSASLDISDLKSGIYLVKVTTFDNSTQVLRFVKQ